MAPMNPNTAQTTKRLSGLNSEAMSMPPSRFAGDFILKFEIGEPDLMMQCDIKPEKKLLYFDYTNDFNSVECYCTAI